MPVPLFDVHGPLAPLRDRLDTALLEAARAGQYILGPQVAAFEEEFAAAVGSAHAVGVANGTDALTLALLALGVGAGDEVVVPAFTFYASAEAIPPTGAAPVFCDIDPDTLCVTADTVRAALTPRTKAVIAVDLFGNPAPVPEIEALGVPVIADAAQAAGARLDGHPAGSLGALATFSFFPSKNLACFGDGGAVTTSDAALAERLRMLRFHGSRDKKTFELIGRNSRLDELQAAVLRVVLPELEGWADGRRAAGRAYEEAGLGELVGLPVPTAGAEPAWHLYVIRHARAAELGAGLVERGVQARVYYDRPLHRQPALAPWSEGVSLPVTDEAARSHLALPMSPLLGTEQAVEVTEAVRAVLGA